jgi:hypothetical protein
MSPSLKTQNLVLRKLIASIEHCNGSEADKVEATLLLRKLGGNSLVTMAFKTVLGLLLSG